MVVWILIWVFKVPALVWHATEAFTLQNSDRLIWTDVIHMVSFTAVFSFGTWIIFNVPWNYYYVFVIEKEFLSPEMTTCKFLCKAYLTHIFKVLVNAIIFGLFIIVFDSIILVDKVDENEDTQGKTIYYNFWVLFFIVLAYYVIAQVF
jgi:hypothetical protein